MRLDSILVSISIIAPRASAVQGWWPCDDFSNVVFALRQIAYVGRRGDGGAAPKTWLSIAGEVGIGYIAHGGLVMILHG